MNGGGTAPAPDTITFDCYGTLVDFDLNRVTRAILGDRLRIDGVHEAEFLDDFRVMRFQAVLEPYRPYEALLRVTLEQAMRLHGMPYRGADGDALVAAVPAFGPFPEVPGALTRLREKYRLAIISNTDDDLIRGNVERIGVDFDFVITAQQARAYKPRREAFEYALRRVGRTPAQVVHVAQGFEYDIMPTHEFGMRRIWINRGGRRGSSAFMPYEELPDMSRLPTLLGLPPASVP
ncbi:MAG TPA: haloacid dehalogenase type II [bacterium]|nr:haloacid dehalogenase type II [bacterium]